MGRREKGAGRLTIDTSRVQAAVGWVGGKTVATSDASFASRTAFCAVSLIAMDSQPLATVLADSAGCRRSLCKHGHAVETGERTSINDKWVAPPLVVEAVEGEISLRRNTNRRN